jgi:CubicO group peptidase (beta-lactamase class C family)
MSPSFSTTKGVASTLAHVLVDRGLLDYEAPVADYWPEFAQNGKAGITVRHVLAHQSGLYHVRRMVDRADRMLDWEYMVGAIERAAPVHPPGTRTGYHGFTYGFLVGELVQRVTESASPRPCGDDRGAARPRRALRRHAARPAPPRREAHLAAAWRARSRARVVRWQGPLIGDALAGSATVAQRLLDLAAVRLDLPSILDALVPRGLSAFDFGAADTLQAAIPAANGASSPPARSRACTPRSRVAAR